MSKLFNLSLFTVIIFQLFLLLNLKITLFLYLSILLIIILFLISNKIKILLLEKNNTELLFFWNNIYKNYLLNKQIKKNIFSLNKHIYAQIYNLIIYNFLILIK